MAWNLDSDRPIYTQIVERLMVQIVSGKYLPGSWLPSVRELASEAAVNPNTMQKAYTELERSGLIVTQRTTGRMVTEDNEMINQIRQTLAMKQLELFLQQMKELGYNEEQIVQLLKDNSQKN